MTDKVQKIREELVRLKEETSIGLSEHENGVEQGRMEIINAISSLLDSMQEEPVSEELEAAARHYLYSNILYDDVYVGNPTDKDCIEMFKAGAQWKEQKLMAKAVDVTIAIPYPNGDGGYTQLVDSKEGLPFGENLKVLVIKED